MSCISYAYNICVVSDGIKAVNLGGGTTSIYFCLGWYLAHTLSPLAEEVERAACGNEFPG